MLHWHPLLLNLPFFFLMFDEIKTKSCRRSVFCVTDLYYLPTVFYSSKVYCFITRKMMNSLLYFKQKKQEPANAVGGTKNPDDELTCSVCLEQVDTGELVRSLPCLHQVKYFDSYFYFCVQPMRRVVF